MKHTSQVYRVEKPRFSSLVFAGMIFGLYEAYLTKVLWAPPWGDPVIIAGFAPFETLLLVFWWHAWFSFIIPLLVAEKLLTGSTSLGASLPGKLGTFFNSWGGLAAVMTFGGLFQSLNSPSPADSLFSGISTTAILVLLVLIWKRVTRERNYKMEDLLPNRKQCQVLLIPAGMMYLAMGILIRPDWYPNLIGHLMIWLLYAVVIFLFTRSQKQAPQVSEAAEIESWAYKRWLLLVGIFPVAATAGKILLTGLFEIIAVICWFGGIAYGLATFIQAVKLTFPTEGDEAHA